MQCNRIEERVTSLEKQLSFWKYVAATLLIVFIGVAAIAGSEEHVKAKELTVSDGSGRVIVQSDGVLLYDATDKLRATLGVETNHSTLKLHDRGGKPRMVLDVSDAGGRILFLEPSGEARKAIEADGR